MQTHPAIAALPATARPLSLSQPAAGTAGSGGFLAHVTGILAWQGSDASESAAGSQARPDDADSPAPTDSSGPDDTGAPNDSAMAQGTDPDPDLAMGPPVPVEPAPTMDQPWGTGAVIVAPWPGSDSRLPGAGWQPAATPVAGPTAGTTGPNAANPVRSGAAVAQNQPGLRWEPAPAPTGAPPDSTSGDDQAGDHFARQPDGQAAGLAGQVQDPARNPAPGMQEPKTDLRAALPVAGAWQARPIIGGPPAGQAAGTGPEPPTTGDPEPAPFTGPLPDRSLRPDIATDTRVAADLGLRNAPPVRAQAPRSAAQPDSPTAAPAMAAPSAPSLPTAAPAVVSLPQFAGFPAPPGDPAPPNGDIFGATPWAMHPLATALAPAGGSVPGAGPGAPTPAHMAQAVFDQLTAHVSRDGSGRIAIALDPVELGRVEMVFQPRDGGLMLTLSVDRPETLDLIRRHIGQLQSDLQAMGLDRLDLNLDLNTAGGRRGSLLPHPWSAAGPPGTPGTPPPDRPGIALDTIAPRPSAPGRLDLRL